MEQKKTASTKPRITLDRVLSRAGIASRTTSLEWIKLGRIKVNGKVIKNPDHWVENDKDTIHFDGRPLQAEEKLYIALNKPTGVVTSHGDKEGRPTVYDLLKDLGRWVFPVGRLDMDTSGLLLLTNDSAFSDRLLNPDSKVPKTYYVKVAGEMTAEHYSALESGLDIGRGERTGPATAREVRKAEKNTWFELTITEGKNRQVRRMCEAIEKPVRKLVRIRIGSYALGEIPIGQFITLGPADLDKCSDLGVPTPPDGNQRSV